MLRSLIRKLTRREAGQALPLFGLFLFVFIGFVAMSIDVGRYVWARTQMQAAVDAAALAAAQSMPSQTAADAKATEYWLDNSGFIQAQGTNVQFAVEYPPGNKAIRVSASADIPTWFARLFGVDHWTVSASGDAESQVLDIAVVLDVSGSMCFDSFAQVEKSISYQMSPGRLTPSGGFAFPRLANNINSTQTTIQLNDVRIFTSTNSSTNWNNFGTTFNSTTPYWQRTTGGSDPSLRAGIIKIDDELMKITAVNVATNTLTVQRGIQNRYKSQGTTATSHSANAEVWANRTGYSSTGDYCELASYYQATTAQNGPHMPFDGAISNAQYFTTLFDPAYDKIGLAKYSSSASIVENLSSNLATIANSMDTILFPAGGTNIAHGLAKGRFILDGSGKRANAVRVLVILTDGVPTNYCSNSGAYTSNSTSCTTQSDSTPSTCPASNTAITHAKNQATAAKDAGIIVFTIGLGDGVLDCVLEDIATLGGGTYYKAPTVAQLDEAFQAIAEQTHIALVK